MFAKLLTKWQRTKISPHSFKETDTFCMKKIEDASDPMNYRWLSLVDTHYKIFTRNRVIRMRGLLPDLIHPSQNGFVPGRTIHTTIDYLAAAIKAASTDPRLCAALGILMDFRKAYGTLDRDFLMRSLGNHGFLELFIKFILDINRATVVRFLANGVQYRPVEVTRDIRQVCPLAPLLFILALEAFYRVLGAETTSIGITLDLECLVVGGYADDNTSLVDRPDRIPGFIVIEDSFGAESGRLLHREKL
jgi:hypothetical protein